VSRGIVIYAFKKAAYGKLAYNLAISIKHHNSALKIAVLTDGNALGHLTADEQSIFDHIVSISENDLYHNGKFSAGKAKLSGYKYFPFDHNLIVDADSICVNDIEPLFDRCTKNVHAQTCSVATEKDEHWNCQWMPFKIVKEVFDLPEKFTAYEINSSFMSVKKSEEAEKFYAQALANFTSNDTHPKLRTWGGGFPDELAFNIAFAQLGINPAFEHQTIISNDTQWPVFFSSKFTNGWAYVINNFHFIGFYGDKWFTDRSLQDQYDRFMVNYLSELGRQHLYKIGHLMKSKHVLNKK